MAVLIQTEVKENALSMSGLSSDFEISSNCNDEYCIREGFNEARETSHQETNPSTKDLAGILESEILSPSFDYIFRFLAEGQTLNQRAWRCALCHTLEVNACIWMVLGKISKLGPSILVPFRGIRTFERGTAVCLVGLFSAILVGFHLRQVVCTCPRRGIFDVIIAWHMLCCHGDLVAGVLRQ